MPNLHERLASQIEGEVHSDAFTRGRYATDASIYQLMPVGVVVPKRDEDVQAALSRKPYYFIPVNVEVPFGPDLPIRNIGEINKFVIQDWAKINPLRAQWIERFNREVVK